MYKSKLQELCQQQKLAPPKYTCIKDGYDHRPQFKASVVVAGVTFDTLTACRSSKQALDQAAQLAFLHFTSDEKSEKMKSKKEEVMYKSKLHEVCQQQRWELPKYTCMRDGEGHYPRFKASVVVQGVAFETLSPFNSSKQALSEAARLAFLHFTSHMQEGFKNKLRMYTQRKRLYQPSYYSEKEGNFFKAKVCVDQDWFTSNELCATAEEAENSAAATALLALLTDAFHESDPISYKILLHKLASEEGFSPPVYKTLRYDKSDALQSFSATVEVEGEAFEGAVANSEKLAELNAAKVAYTAFVERKLFEAPNEALKVARCLDSCSISDPQEDATYGSPSNLIQVQGTIGGENEEKGHDSNYTKSYLLSNRVRVFTCMPKMALPKGTVVLPIREDRWAVVALELLYEKEV